MCDVLIFGARSWIGFRLAEAFTSRFPDWSIVGTSSTSLQSDDRQSGDQISPLLVKAATSGDFSTLVHDMRPRIVFNLLRGEDQQGLDIHSCIARDCFELGIRYVYASSALALDGYSKDAVLTEDIPPLSVTPYGHFKGQCENYLTSTFPGDDWLVLRFSSIQGWSPWKSTRNEVFLKKLANGDSVTVDLGIFQNRLLDTVFATAVVDLACNTLGKGVFHLGAEDSSEELFFLRAVAIAFGLDDSLVHAGKRNDLNLGLSCSRLHGSTNDRWRRNECQTIEGLLAVPELQRWRNG
ncbi:NAD(P)-dependent oxidoreductase [bacterium]|nr:NAD(P)-dependent oxidoreductase [bacterium]